MHLVTRIAEYGVIFNDKDEFLMVRFSKEANPSEAWIFPGGRLDEGDKPIEALNREIKEETGLEVKVLFPCEVAMWGKGEDRRYAVFFICNLIEGNLKLSKEHQESNWFTYGDIDNIKFHDESFKKAIENAFKLRNIASNSE
ncbi:NUDIX hydrolase [Candidatus Woesearchaeota archaeon]|nr:NUDIX hydrolase [Candidatus Woesearchaeota archaeon]